VFLLGVTLAGCTAPTANVPAQAPEHARDFLKLDPGNPKLDFVKIEVAKESEGAGAISLTGRVAFDEDHTQRVASPIDGRATNILVRLGDRVRASAPLIELSSPHVGQLQSDAQKAVSDLAVAQKAIDRVHKLAEDGAISDKEVAQADADFKKARSELARTNAQLKALGLSATEPATNITLRAQIPGTVVERNILVGQEVRSDGAAPLITLSSLDTVWVVADVYEQDLGAVSPGARIRVQVPAYPGESFDGKVGHIGDIVDPTSRTVKIRCVVPNPGSRLKAEMFAKIELEDTGQKKVLVIPTRAVINDGDQTKVIVATEGNAFRSRAVQVGPEVNGKIRVLSGLTPGEKIVTDGALFLKHEIDTN
jgi:cobalt-zinc-cadmium efflux system membrane fusion protein